MDVDEYFGTFRLRWRNGVDVIKADVFWRYINAR